MREGGILVVKNPFSPPLVVREIPPPAEMPLPVYMFVGSIRIAAAAGVRVGLHCNGRIDLEGLDARDKGLDLEGLDAIERRTGSGSGCKFFCGI